MKKRRPIFWKNGTPTHAANYRAIRNEPPCCLPLRMEPEHNENATVYTWEEFRAELEAYKLLLSMCPKIKLRRDLAQKVTACDHLVLISD